MMVKDTKTEDGAWHLDRKVPIALIFAILLQGLGLVWYGSKMDSRIAELERNDLGKEARVVKLEDDRNLSRDRLIRLEVTTQTIIDGLKRVEGKLDSLADRLEKP